MLPTTRRGGDKDVGFDDTQMIYIFEDDGVGLLALRLLGLFYVLYLARGTVGLWDDR